MITKMKLSSRILIFCLILVAAVVPTGTAYARLAKCRADPIFYLSNGEKVTVILDIDTDASNVRNVNYVIHVPVGVRITKVVFTAGGIGRKEVYKAVQDSTADTYITETVVTTKGGPYAVTASSSLTAGTMTSATGFNGDVLQVVLIQSLEALRK